MEKPLIRALVLEDDPTYAFLIKEFLGSSQHYLFETVHVPKLSLGLERLKNERFDIGLIDLGLPDSDGLETITQVNEAASYLPLIILSGNTDEALSLAGATQGAQDYLLKGSFDSLGLTRAIHYAIERKKIEKFKEEFSALVSFELRAPLSVIKGAVDGIKDGDLGPLNDKQKQFLELASKHVKRLNKIVTNILDLARYESGKATLENKAFSLKGILADALASVKDELPRAIRIVDDVSPEFPQILSDPDLVTEALSHLIGNSLRIAKSEVLIEAHVDEGGKTAHIIVSDDGVGLPQEKLKEIFNRFAQIGNQAVRRESQGAGLGLSLCKTLAHVLGAPLWAENPGKGTRFHFVLPLNISS